MSKLNILIPCAGRGSRFAEAGYELPKPLIDVEGKPMIEVVVNCLPLDAQYHFVIQKEHSEKFPDFRKTLYRIANGCIICEVDHVTEGAACTALLFKDYINNDTPLLIANSDQYVDWDYNKFFQIMRDPQYDGGIITFESDDPKFSYVREGHGGGFAVEVKEKEVISNLATTGIYYYSKGSDFVRYAEQMISINDRFKNEFYIAPVYNYFIDDGKIIYTYPCESMTCLGTPEDLDKYLNR